jgi:hypothetical protein
VWNGSPFFFVKYQDGEERVNQGRQEEEEVNRAAGFIRYLF